MQKTILFLRNKFSYYLTNILLRFYNEIITSILNMLLIIPFDYFLTNHFGDGSEYKMTKTYFVALGLYSVFVVVAAAIMPRIKERRTRNEIDNLAKKNAITFAQRKKIQKVLDEILICKGLFTKEGGMQFLMTNLFSTGIIVCFFGVEGFILAFMNGQKFTVPIIYAVIFFIILFLESILDEHFVAKIKRKKTDDTSEHDKRYEKNKTLLSLIMRNAGGTNSLSENLSNLITEDAIDDMCEILSISWDKRDISKKDKSSQKNKKKTLTKGKSEKVDGKFPPKNQKFAQKKQLKNLHP